MTAATPTARFNAASVLVTGAGGLIGRSLITHLAKAGAHITTLGRSARAEVRGHALIAEPFRADVIRSLAKGLTYDYVFHLAAYGVDPKARDIAEMVDVNVGASLALIETVTARRAYVHVGTCSEYAPRTDGRNLRETDEVETAKLYGATKAAATIAANAIAATRKQPFVAARLFHVYGPGEAPHRLLPSLASQLLKGQTVPLSPGTQVRDFMSVMDAVEGLTALAAATTERGGQSIVNLCTGEATSVRAFAEAACRTVGAPMNQLDFGALQFRPDDVMHLVGDTTALHGMTDWRPRYALSDGIAAALSSLGGGK